MEGTWERLLAVVGLESLTLLKLPCERCLFAYAVRPKVDGSANGGRAGPAVPAALNWALLEAFGGGRADGLFPTTEVESERASSCS